MRERKGMLYSKSTKIVIPKSGPKPLYYNTHVMYFRNLLDFLEIPYVLKGVIEKGTTKFVVMIGDKKVLMDFSDHTDCLDSDSFDAYFKYHYSYAKHAGYDKMYPFAPISFYDWPRYRDLSTKISYTGVSNTILNMQRPYAGALERRTQVQKMLKLRYGNEVIIPLTSQVNYWKKINNCLVHVFVPGARNDMVDRGHAQYMAFGCCTIAPPITDVFPYDGELIPGVHYVQCKPDYSDLIEKIEWCKNNRENCVEIGSNAKKLFERSCLPGRLWNWVLEKI